MIGRNPVRDVSRALVIGGAALFTVSLFLHWYSLGSGTAETAFQGYKRYDIVLLVVAVAAMGLALIDLTVRWDGALSLGGMLGLFSLGSLVISPIEGFTEGLQAGYWLALAGSVVWVVGGVMALAGPVSPVQPIGMGSAVRPLPPATAPAQAPPAPTDEPPPPAQREQPAPPPSYPPAGWYQDAASGQLRWWDGERWTENYHEA